MKPKHIALVAGVAVFAGVAYCLRKTAKAEVASLADILDWREARTVADIGAGRGAMAVAAAKRVGPNGHVFAAEVEPKKIRAIQKKVAKQRLPNVTVIHAQPDDSNLPAGRCDAILLRGSYHHFTNPGAINASLLRALRPGGRMAVIDFPPKLWLTLIAPVKGAPANRGGHGISRQLLTEELAAAGFEVEQVIPRWFLGTYCVVFRKPAAA